MTKKDSTFYPIELQGLVTTGFPRLDSQQRKLRAKKLKKQLQPSNYFKNGGTCNISLKV